MHTAVRRITRLMFCLFLDYEYVEDAALISVLIFLNFIGLSRVQPSSTFRKISPSKFRNLFRIARLIKYPSLTSLPSSSWLEPDNHLTKLLRIERSQITSFPNAANSAYSNCLFAQVPSTKASTYTVYLVMCAFLSWVFLGL